MAKGKGATTKKRRPPSSGSSSRARQTKTAPKAPAAQPDARVQAQGQQLPQPQLPDPNAWRFVGRTQLAELLGTHPDTVSDYTRGGMPVTEKGGHGKESVYDAVECLAWWREQQGTSAKEMAQTRQYESQAALNELKLQQQRGELVPKADVIAANQTVMKAVAAKIRALPHRFVQTGLVHRERQVDATRLCLDVLQELAALKTVDDAEAVAAQEALVE